VPTSQRACPEAQCTQTTCRWVVRRTLAEASEVPAHCPNIVPLPAANPDGLHRAAAEPLYLTPKAAGVLAGVPTGGGRDVIRTLLIARRLVILEPRVGPRTWIGGGTKTRRDEAEETPPTTPTETETHYIEVELVDRAGHPVAGERYRIVLPDGAAREGSLDRDGKVRLEPVAAGMCSISFPSLTDVRTRRASEASSSPSATSGAPQNG
jgi:hypothetical protein